MLFTFLALTSGFYQVLRSDEVLEHSTVENKKNLKNNAHNKALKKVTGQKNSDSSESGTREEEDDVKPRKKIVSKRKLQNSEGLKKRKRPEKETKVSGKKQIKATKTMSEDNSDAEECGIVSEDDQTQSSAEKPVKVFLFIFLRSPLNLNAHHHLSIFIL